MFDFARTCSLILTLTCAATAATAQCTGQTLDHRMSPADVAELAQVVAATPYGEGLIWQAAKDGRQIALVGTFHLSDPRHDALMDRISPLIAAADRVLVEITTQGEADLQRHLAADPGLMLLPDNGSLIGQVDEKTWAEIAAAARERDLPPFMAARFQPWYLTMTLAIPPCAMTALVAGERGLDLQIMTQAADSGVPVEAIEDWNTALTLLRQGTFAEQVEMLQLTLADPDLQAEAMASMIEDYFAGHIARIWEMSRMSARWTTGLAAAEAEAAFDRFAEGLLVDRNRAWVPVILKAAEAEPSVLVAVGAAHLPGKDGLLVALEQQGWTITRLY